MEAFKKLQELKQDKEIIRIPFAIKCRNHEMAAHEAILYENFNEGLYYVIHHIYGLSVTNFNDYEYNQLAKIINIENIPIYSKYDNEDYIKMERE